MLRLRGLSAGYGRRQVLNNIDLDLAAGDVLAVLGANGAGKSTLVRAIAGLVPASSGEVDFDGQPIGHLSAARRLRRGIAFVPEGQQCFPAMTVLENLQVGASTRVRKRAELAQALEPVLELFPRLGERAKQAAGTLSGGERQMLSIGRALLSDPMILILDEPSHGLAPIVVEQLSEKLQQVARSVSILLVEQNLTVPRICATRIVVIQNGGVGRSGTPAELLGSQDLVSAYLGIDHAESGTA